MTLWIASGACVLAAELPASADEGGVPFWMSGQEASLAAVAPDPGIYVPLTAYYYDGSASASRTFEHGNIISAGLESQIPLVFVYPTFAPDLKILGAQPAFTLGFGGGHERVTAKISTSRRGTILERSDNVWGVTDLYPMMSLFWNVESVSHVMAYLTGDAPVGDYDPNRLANISLGHGAVDAGGGYTYLNDKSGLEASAVAGFTYNLANTQVNYKSGVDSHLDYAISQFLSEHFHIGVVGYLYYQLGSDSGSGNLVGPFKSKVAAIGGEMGSPFKLAGNNWYVNFRGYDEFWAVHRLQGYNLWLSVSIPLGGVKSKSKDDEKKKAGDPNPP